MRLLFQEILFRFDKLRKDVGTVLEFHKLSYQLALKNVTWVGERGEGTDILANKIVNQV